jgi:hypothetical protein
MKTITLNRLRKVEACEDGCEWFEDMYGNKQVDIRELANTLLWQADEIDEEGDNYIDLGDSHPALWLLWGLVVFLSDKDRKLLLAEVLRMLGADGHDCKYERDRIRLRLDDSSSVYLSEFYPELSELVMKGYIDIRELAEYVFITYLNYPSKS